MSIENLFESLNLHSESNINILPLLSLPESILVAEILPKLPIKDLLRICQVNKYIKQLCNGDVCRYKTLLDFEKRTKPPDQTWFRYYINLLIEKNVKPANILFKHLTTSDILGGIDTGINDFLSNSYHIDDINIVPEKTTILQVINSSIYMLNHHYIYFAAYLVLFCNKVINPDNTSKISFLGIYAKLSQSFYTSTPNAKLNTTNLLIVFPYDDHYVGIITKIILRTSPNIKIYLEDKLRIASPQLLNSFIITLSDIINM
jgi:hypothetical protein